MRQSAFFPLANSPESPRFLLFFLSKIGMRQLYDLGKFFKKRYAKFIDEDFKSEDVMVVSSNSERAITSAQALLYGMYPAKRKSTWLEGEDWQPLPFFSHTPGSSDPLLRPTDYNCKAYEKVLKAQNAELVNKMNTEFANFYKFLAQVTGYPEVDFGTASKISNLHREIIHNMTQPEWVYKRWPEYGNRTTLELLKENRRIDRISEFNSPEKAKLRGGLLVGDWVQRALNVSLGLREKPKKMLLYSTHDGTVSSLQYAMGIGNDLLVPYAACVIMELYRTKDNVTLAKILYRNETNTNTVYALTVPGCTELCPVEQLAKVLSPMMIKSEKKLEKVCSKKGFHLKSSSSSSSEEIKARNEDDD